MNLQEDASKNRYRAVIMHEVGGQEAAIILGQAREMAESGPLRYGF
jgi:hypothetical protein